MLPEHKILIDFLNNRFEDFDPAELNPEKWSTLVSEASRHRVAPLLYDKIRLACADAIIPEDVVRKLREKYLANAHRNTVLYHQLSELVAHFNDKSIPVVLLKGAHLAEFIYNDIALRPMSDLDIMVKEEHLSEAVQIAFSAGYRFLQDQNHEKEETIDIGNFDYGIMPDFKHFKALIHPESKCMLEIHCFIASEESPFNISMMELWKQARPENLNGNSVFVLSPEDLIIYLCLHAAYDHLFDFGLSALYDISIAIKHYENDLNWDEISHRSGQWHATHCLLLALYFTKKWMGANIPDELFENFHLDKMVHIAEERIFKTFETTPLHPHYTQWRNRKGMRNRMRYVSDVLFPSREFMTNRYLQPKDSRVLIGSYFYRFFQAFRGIYAIAKSMFHDAQYSSRLKQGDNDFHLREWLIKS